MSVKSKLNQWVIFNFLAITVLTSCGGGSSSTSEVPVDSDEVNVTFSNAVFSESIQALDEEALVYSVEVGEENEYGCLIIDDEINCPVNFEDLQENDNEMLVTAQYLVDDPEATDDSTDNSVSNLRLAKLPVFNPEQGKSRTGKKPYVVGQGVVKVAVSKVEELGLANNKVLDIEESNADGDIEVLDFLAVNGLADRLGAGSVCGNLKIDEGEQCDGDVSCDSECTNTSYANVISEGVGFSSGYILPRGEVDEQLDVFPFTVTSEDNNFIQASARTVGGDSRAPTNIRLYQDYGTEDEALLVESSGIESLIEWGGLTPGDYAVVVRKKATVKNQNVTQNLVSYSLETILGSSIFNTGFNQVQRNFIAIDEVNKDYNFFFRVSADDITNLNLEQRSIQPRKISLYTGSDESEFEVNDIIPQIVKVARSGVYGRITSSLSPTTKKFDSDVTFIGAIYRNGSQSIYTLGIGENFGDGPELDVGEYVVVLNTRNRYVEVPEGADVVKLDTSINDNVRAGVCGNEVIERNEVCDGSNCSDECNRTSQAARLNLDTAFIKNSFEEGDGRGSIRLFGSPDEKVILDFDRVGSSTLDCEIQVGHTLLRLPVDSNFYNIDDDFLAQGATRDFAVPYENNCPGTPTPVNFSEQTELGDIQFLDLKLRQVNTEVDNPYIMKAKVTRYHEIDNDQATFYKSAFGGNIFASKVYFGVAEDDLQRDTTSYLAVVRDADTKECIGGVTLKTYTYSDFNSLEVVLNSFSGQSLGQRADFSEDQCASLLFENIGSPVFFEVTKSSPSLSDQDKFVLDVIPMEAKTGDTVTELDFDDIDQFDNNNTSYVANVSEDIAAGETVIVNFEIRQGEFMVYNFPSRVDGMYYRLVTKSGLLFDDGYKIFLEGAAQFESTPVLPAGDYALEVYNTTDATVSDYQFRMEKSYNILPGVYTALVTYPKINLILNLSNDGSGGLVDFQLTDESGSSGVGDCNNPALTLEENNVDRADIQANFCGTVNLSLVGTPSEINLDITDEDFIPNLTTERYFYFTLEKDQQ
jgi:hypothetical protein